MHRLARPPGMPRCTSCEPCPRCLTVSRPLCPRRYPFRMYHRVYHPAGPKLWAMVAVGCMMFLICIGSTLGAVRSIINNWSSYEFFAS